MQWRCAARTTEGGIVLNNPGPTLAIEPTADDLVYIGELERRAGWLGWLAPIFQKEAEENLAQMRANRGADADDYALRQTERLRASPKELSLVATLEFCSQRPSEEDERLAKSLAQKLRTRKSRKKTTEAAAPKPGPDRC